MKGSPDSAGCVVEFAQGGETPAGTASDLLATGCAMLTALLPDQTDYRATMPRNHEPCTVDR
ncbi:hypothetical protein RM533_12825 [Croceicoccus sp. F390]|uniref:Uncharacterized protein n=1 Tax=Croceicoccus esteveae TaxID=3075597 RepID=A0ABU2ZKY9_9SPHN|nr:hypothetical protein [Croceicoccus sp. F390]MDT0577051.1 hypothetical protein [Croceicoccus sp. F390]